MTRLRAEPGETAAALKALFEERYGRTPFVLEYLSRRPDVALPHVLKSDAILSGHGAMDARTTELIASAVAAALRCDFCMLVHMDRALGLGVSTDEIFQALLVAGAICESSSHAHAFRVLERVEAKRRQREAPPEA